MISPVRSGDAAGGPRAVHQFVPALIPRDATGSHTLLLRDALRAAGWRSELYAEATHDELLGETVPVERYPDQACPDDVLVYQFSTSSMVAALLLAQPQQLVLDFHNITAPEDFGAWDPEAAERSRLAYDQLSALARHARLGIAVSAFNEADLRAAGCSNTVVAPVLVDLERTVAEPDAPVAARLAATKELGGCDWLFVGRLAPSKAQHQLIKALWAYRRLYDHEARLHLVGPTASRRYHAALRSFVKQLGLQGAVRFSGAVSDRALAAYLGAADVYVSLSVHEGFGVPLVESMQAGVPVVALDRAAVPETLAGAGIVLESDEPALVAAAVHRVLADQALRQTLVRAGHCRSASFSVARGAASHLRAIATVAGPPPGCSG